jgi:Family of unknown function (DUF6505)
MKFLKTIRFDASDERVFELAAAPEEWAVSGAFAFADLADDAIAGKTKQAFANGFLGISSFGRSTFATIAEATPEDLDEVEQRLAAHLVASYGAPGFEAARLVAKEEAEFVVNLCRDARINTVFTVRRTRAGNDQFKEEFRIIRPPTGESPHARIWTVVEDDA